MRKQTSNWFIGLKLLALVLVLSLAFGLDRWMAHQVTQSLASGNSRGVDQTRFIAGITLGSALLGLTWFIVLYRKAGALVGWVYLVLGLALNVLPLLTASLVGQDTASGGGFSAWFGALMGGDFFVYTCMYIPFVGLFSMIVKQPGDTDGGNV